MSKAHLMFEGYSPGAVFIAIALLGLASSWWAVFCIKGYRNDYIERGFFLCLMWSLIWLAGEGILLVILFALSGNLFGPV